MPLALTFVAGAMLYVIGMRSSARPIHPVLSGEPADLLAGLVAMMSLDVAFR